MLSQLILVVLTFQLHAYMVEKPAAAMADHAPDGTPIAQLVPLSQFVNWPTEAQMRYLEAINISLVTIEKNMGRYMDDDLMASRRFPLQDLFQAFLGELAGADLTVSQPAPGAAGNAGSTGATILSAPSVTLRCFSAGWPVEGQRCVPPTKAQYSTGEGKIIQLQCPAGEILCHPVVFGVINPNCGTGNNKPFVTAAATSPSSTTTTEPIPRATPTAPAPVAPVPQSGTPGRPGSAGTDGTGSTGGTPGSDAPPSTISPTNDGTPATPSGTRKTTPPNTPATPTDKKEPYIYKRDRAEENRISREQGVRLVANTPVSSSGVKPLCAQPSQKKTSSYACYKEAKEKKSCVNYKDNLPMATKFFNGFNSFCGANGFNGNKYLKGRDSAKEDMKQTCNTIRLTLERGTGDMRSNKTNAPEKDKSPAGQGTISL